VATFSTTGEARSLALHGGRVALAEGSGGVRIFDASRPRVPRVETTLRDAEGAVDVAFVAERLLVAGGSRGLLVYAARPGRSDRPRELAAVEAVTGVTGAGALALVVDAGAGLRIVDPATDPPREVAHVALPRRHAAASVAHANGLAYVACDGGPLAIVDVTRPAEPELVFPVDRQLRIRLD
jgi:hypothetical protein